MATAQEVQQRVSYARTMLETGINVQTTCTMLQVKFKVSRSTAYTDVRTADLELRESEDAPEHFDLEGKRLDDISPLDPVTLQAQAVHLYNCAVADRDIKGALQAIKALDTILGWNGRKAELEGDASNGYT